jgi:predicted secreted hydrolase
VRSFPRPALILLAACLVLAGCAAPARPEVRAGVSAVEAMGAANDPGWARATAPRPFVFPADHGPHQEFAIEWWYWTGNLDAGGRHFGYQLTIFRRGLTPNPAERGSNWAASNIYMAHFALSDVATGRFYAFERFSRDAAGLAGASGAPFRVFLDDWGAEGSGPEGMTMRLRAAQDDVAIDLTLDSTKPPTLQGDRGLSQKGPSPGNASLYYSLTRMATTGTVRVGEASYPVTGLSWMDREWSTSALEGGIVGWDWFALHLDTGEDLMFYQLRTADGGASPFTKGSLTGPDGAVRQLAAADVRLTPLDTWRSPRSGAEYPSRWRLEAPALGLDLSLEPFLKDQELPVSVVYWEGAVRIAGTAGGRPVGGSGYVEMTGYGDGGR